VPVTAQRATPEDDLGFVNLEAWCEHAVGQRMSASQPTSTGGEVTQVCEFVE